jgi:hypothetical protein
MDEISEAFWLVMNLLRERRKLRLVTRRLSRLVARLA